MFNGPVHVLAKTIKAVMASAMEAEMKALFMSAQLLFEHRRQTPEDVGHPQSPTQIGTDNNVVMCQNSSLVRSSTKC